MANRAEDMMRRMMGMPSRKEEERARRRSGKETSGHRKNNEFSGKTSAGRRRHPDPSFDAAAVMKSVAEDVEYTEIREFESTTIAGTDSRSGRASVYTEEQVSDAEYVEIKTKER